MKKHITSEHNQNKPIKCDKCNVAFLRIIYLKAHIMSVHEQNKPTKCDVCNFAFPRINYLKAHKISLFYNWVFPIHVFLSYVQLTF